MTFLNGYFSIYAQQKSHPNSHGVGSISKLQTTGRRGDERKPFNFFPRAGSCSSSTNKNANKYASQGLITSLCLQQLLRCLRVLHAARRNAQLSLQRKGGDSRSFQFHQLSVQRRLRRYASPLVTCIITTAWYTTAIMKIRSHEIQRWFKMVLCHLV